MAYVIVRGHDVEKKNVETRSPEGPEKGLKEFL
jgi:hypothetical protein